MYVVIFVFMYVLPVSETFVWSYTVYHFKENNYPVVFLPYLCITLINKNQFTTMILVAQTSNIIRIEKRYFTISVLPKYGRASEYTYLHSTDRKTQWIKAKWRLR